MSKYRIAEPDMNGKVWIEDMEAGKVFNGYDFMGSVNWEDYGGDAYWMDQDEAETVLADLEAADYDLDQEESFNRCCLLAKEIARTGWTNSLNPMVRELIEEADQAGIEISFDDSWIAVNDEVFYLED